ncbi:HAD-IIB family hydrolase [Rhodoferax sp. U11-2br]|uniref:HAD-IIB family hydrolase n=1 Tax=Rhodoferax sp. U11-2br TaxID=2838878 RepID=UPI001BE7BA65|nr:HAD-IIB family hydrolase [Rhodoferax sp. U11-2br]MBT3068694.1 HAD-IIB family hydrolase [Rhodoferax sp. U11-2br]
MLPLSSWPLAQRRGIIGVFTDIDDTLTTHQAITPDALQALADLKAAGLVVIPITGRPIGWCEPHAYGDAGHGLPAWPVDAMVAENGGVAFAPTLTSKNGLQTLLNQGQQLSKIYYTEATERAVNTQKLQHVAQRILSEIPGTTLSQDSIGRETDIAIDHAEHVTLAPEKVAQVVALMRSEGMQATVSSIHINGWYGSHNKWEAARWMVSSLFGRQLEHELDRWVYVGDSTNDQLMFRHFPHSVGVANIHHFDGQLQHWPRYETVGERGAGFAELAQAILQARLA